MAAAASCGLGWEEPEASRPAGGSSSRMKVRFAGQVEEAKRRAWNLRCPEKERTRKALPLDGPNDSVKGWKPLDWDFLVDQPGRSSSLGFVRGFLISTLVFFFFQFLLFPVLSFFSAYLFFPFLKISLECVFLMHFFNFS